MKKHRSTVFTRLLLFLLIFIPIAYIGVSLSKNKNPIEEFKKLISNKEKSETTNFTKSSEELTLELQRKEIERLTQALQECQQSN